MRITVGFRHCLSASVCSLVCFNLASEEMFRRHPNGVRSQDLPPLIRDRAIDNPRTISPASNCGQTIHASRARESTGLPRGSFASCYTTPPSQSYSPLPSCPDPIETVSYSITQTNSPNTCRFSASSAFKQRVKNAGLSAEAQSFHVAVVFINAFGRLIFFDAIATSVLWVV